MGRYFFSPLPSHPLRIMRAVCGAVMLIHYLRVAPVFLDLFSPKYMGFSPAFPVPHADAYYYALLAAILMSAMAVILGWRARWALMALFLGQTATTYLNPGAFWGWGFMIRHFLLFLWLTEPWAGKAFAPAWTWRIFQIQTVFIYLISQLNRWGDSTWLSGGAVFRVLSDGDFSRWMNVDWAAYREVLRPLGYFGLALEWAGALLLFLGPLQMPVALLLIAMHVGLGFAAIVQVWQPLMIGALLFFMPARWFSSAASACQFRRRPEIAGLIVGFFALSLVHAWPKRLLSQPLAKITAGAGMPLRYMRLSETSRMDMFARFGSNGRKCLFVLAENDDKSLRLLTRDQPKGCRELRPRGDSGDEISLTILRMQRNRLPRRSRVGHYLCARAAPAAAVYAGRILEWPSRAEPLLYFDCRTFEFKEGQPANLTGYLNEQSLWFPVRTAPPL